MDEKQRILNTLEMLEKSENAKALVPLFTKVIKKLTSTAERSDSFIGHAGRPGMVGGSSPRGTIGGGGGESEQTSNIPEKINGVRVSGSLRDNIDAKTGQVNSERQKLHDSITNKLFEGKSKATGTPVMTFMGGGSGAGKSTATNDPNVDSPDKDETVVLNSDDIKDMIPEYKEMQDAGDKNAANYVHAESSLISYNALDMAQEQGYNTMLDGTGDGSTEAMLESIATARNAGMTVNGIYVTCDTETAVSRCTARAEKTGRVVPEGVIRETHAAVSKIFPEIAKEFDSCVLYDTNDTGEIIATCKRGEEINVINAEKYQRFLDKANV